MTVTSAAEAVATWWPEDAGVAPRWATRRDPSRLTFGPAVGALAAAMGTPLMPWQQYVADVALEVLDDGSWAFRTIFVTIPRQGGKTTLCGPVHLHRAMIPPAKGDGRARTFFTAQTRQDARDTWLEIIERVRNSPLTQLAKIRESNGSESCTMPAGYFRVFAPSEEGLHGKPAQLVTVDEVWAFDGVEGQALEQAIRPTFTTTGGQLWLVSTAGTGKSSWMRGYVDRGRALVDAGAGTGTLAYFEWSLAPADAQLVEQGLAPDAEPAQRRRALQLVVDNHPANGYTLDRGAVDDAAANMAPGEFLRAYGNVWTGVSERAIPAHWWTRAGDDGRRVKFDAPPPVGDVVLTFDVAVNRADAAILATWRPAPGGPLRVAVLDAHPGTDWLVDRVRHWQRELRPAAVGHDNAGPVLDLADELARGGMTLQALKYRDMAAACQSWLSGIEHGRVEHANQPALDDAVDNVAVRAVGNEGVWLWGRRQSAGTIAPVVAATVGSWLVDHRPAAGVKPRVGTARRNGSLRRAAA